MKRIHTLVLFLTCSLLSGQTILENQYLRTEINLANPERGFYHHTEVHSGNYNLVNENTLRNYRTEESITLILRVFYLEDFLQKPIDQSYLSGMHQDFNRIRNAGIKVVVRFAYSKDSSPPYNDATPEVVLTHIKQLKEVLYAHSDVVAAVQAGFIGAWGEWYYTDHFAGFSPSDVTDENWADRGDVVSELLNALPAERMIQIRTPGYKMRLYDSELPLSKEEAFTENNNARTGHHNDCFVASSSDFGTYVNPELEKPYLEEETKYTVMGGETCALAPPFSDCENAVSELNRFHYSYLNIDYNQTVLNKWKDQGCFDNVEINLGYRIALDKVSLLNKTNPLSSLEVNLTLENTGFANLYNERYLELTLEHTETKEKYTFKDLKDMREWPLNESFDISISAGFPESIKEGNYNLYVSFPDNSPSLSEMPAYHMQLNNTDIYNEENGLHDLGLSIEITSANEGLAYAGENYFTSDLALVELIEGPREIFSVNGIDCLILFWGREDNDDLRKIWRSENGSSFEEIANIPAGQDYFKDVNVVQGASYSYQYQIKKPNGEETALSSSTSLEKGENTQETPAISLDGEDSDWLNISPVSSSLSSKDSAFILRSFFSIDSLYILLYGDIQDYEVLLNTDNVESTGFQDNVNLGTDFIIRNDSLFEVLGIDLIFLQEVITAKTEDKIEIGLASSSLSNLGETLQIPITAKLNNGEYQLNAFDNTASVIFRTLPPDLPGEFEVSNSVAFPDSRLEVRWERCNRCDSYVLEKSLDGVDFELLKELGRSSTFFYDDFLEDGVYHYRIKSKSNIGFSAYSEIKIGYIGTSSIDDVNSKYKELSLSPNPAKQIISFEEVLSEVLIYDMNGHQLLAKNNVKSINIEDLVEGVYLVKSKNRVARFIKLNQ